MVTSMQKDCWESPPRPLAKIHGTGHYGQISKDHPGIRKIAARPPIIKPRILLWVALFALSNPVFAQQSGSGEADNGADFDLEALVDRISHSKALGFLTKLSLKLDIDGFLKMVREYHDKGGGDDSLEQLHERYDVMVHKLVVLLQDKDEELVKSIDDGRNKLWAMLADAEKFAGM